MLPNFALTLSHEGVGLLHRTPRGWLSVGDVALSDPALDARLAALRDTGLSLAPESGMASKLVIPESEILYTEITSPGPDPALREAAIREGLKDATPYPVADLVFDWSGNGDRIRVAVVARQTLVEAEAFANSHGFAPVCFVARPTSDSFPGEPWFGRTEGADALIGAGTEVTRDVVPIEVVGQAALPAATVKAIFARSAASLGGLGQTPPLTPAPEGTDPDAPAEAGQDAAQPAGPDVATPAPTAPEPTQATDAPDAAPTPEPPVTASRNAPASTDAPTPSPEAPLTRADAPEPPVTASRSAPVAPAGTDAPSPSPDAAAASGDAPEPTLTAARSAAAAPAGTGVPTLSPHARPGDAPEPPVAADRSADAAPPTPVAPPQPAKPLPPRAADPALSTAPKRVEGDGPPPEPGLAAIAWPRAIAPQPSAARADAEPGAVEDTEPLRARSSQPLAADGSATEAEAMTVFGARRRTRVAPPARTGLVVTAALALLLGGVGIWAAFFVTAPGTREDSAALTTDGAELAEAPVDIAPAPDTGPADPEQTATVAPEPAPEPEPEPDVAATPAPADTGSEAPGPTLHSDADGPPAPTSPSELGTVPPAPPQSEPPQLAQVPGAALSAPAPLPAPQIPAPPPAAEAMLADPSAPAEAITVEVTEGSPAVVPELRRTVQSRHLLIEGDTPIPAGAEPLPRPPGLGGDGALRETSQELDPVPVVAPPEPLAAPTPPAPREPDDAGTPSLWTAVPALMGPAAAQIEVPQDAGSGASLVTAALTLAPDGDATQDPRASVTASAAGLVRPPSARPASLPVPRGPTHMTVQRPDSAAPRPSQRPDVIAERAAAVQRSLERATAQAVPRSPLPGTRPSDFSAVVARAARPAPTPTPQPTAQPAAAAAAPASTAAAATAPVAAAPVVAAAPPPTAAPSLPTRASVAQQATETRAINLRRINLIGVFGPSSARRALVRLSNGQVVAVRVGDRLDGGQVAAIGDGELRYVRNGRNTMLRIGG